MPVLPAMFLALAFGQAGALVWAEDEGLQPCSEDQLASTPEVIFNATITATHILPRKPGRGRALLNAAPFFTVPLSSFGPTFLAKGFQMVSELTKAEVCSRCIEGQFSSISFFSWAQALARITEITLRGEANYGNSCGLHRDHVCGPGKLPFVDVPTPALESQTSQVCDDAGTDRCCLQHDSSYTGMTLTFCGRELFDLQECYINAELLKCMLGVDRSQATFFDGMHAESDHKLSDCTECLYSHLPCLTPSANAGKLDVRWPKSKEQVHYFGEMGCLEGKCYNATHYRAFGLGDIDSFDQSR